MHRRLQPLHPNLRLADQRWPNQSRQKQQQPSPRQRLRVIQTGKLFEGKTARRQNCVRAVPENQTVLRHFRNQFNFDARTQRDLRHAKGAAGMRSRLSAKHLADELAGTVGHQMLLGEIAGGVHQ